MLNDLKHYSLVFNCLYYSFVYYIFVQLFDFFTEGLKGSIKKLGLTQGIFYQLMINISANISRDLGMVPGGEFRRAVVEVFT